MDAPVQHENYTEILVPNGVEGWTDKVNKIVMDTEGESQWTVKLKFWKSMVGMRGELYDDVGLSHLRNEQGGCKNSGIGTGNATDLENQQIFFNQMILPF